MTWKKRIRLYLLALWALLALASVYSVYLTRGTPAWYAADRADDGQRFTAANQSDQKLADLLSYTSDIAAAQRRRSKAGGGSTATSPASPVIRSKTIQFTELQINEFLKKWDVLLGGTFSAALARNITGGRVILLDNQMLIAGTLKDAGMLSNTVISVAFAPSLDDHSQLHPTLRQVYGGRLPVPWSFLGAPRRRLVDTIEFDLPEWQRAAHVFPDGLANHEAMAVVWARLLLASLHGQSVDSILLLPCDMGDFRPVVPVRLVDLKLGDRQISFTIRPLTDSELAELTNQLAPPP